MKKISKLLSIVLALVMVMSFALVASAEETDVTFTKVSATELTAGTYVIYGLSAKEANGATTAFMTTENCTATRLMAADLTIENDSVTTSDTNAMWELIDAEGGFYVKSVATQKYLYWSSEAGGGNKIYQTESLDEADVWSVVEISKESGDGYTLAQADGRGLSCNQFGSDSNKYLGFAAYAYETTTCACLLEFYREGEAVASPAGPVDCEIPGTLTYTFESDEAASLGVSFRWIATANGELGVAKMGENYMTNVQINGTYGEIGNYGYVVKTGDTVEVIVYGYGAGTINVPVEFVTGNENDDVVGSESNPEEINANTEYVKALESGEYFYQYTATVAGEVTINTAGNGTHNMEVFVNGDATKIYSNWDNDGAFVKLNVAAGDVLTIKVYFDFPGAGTITFTVVAETADVEPEPEPTPDPKAPVANGDTVMIYFPNGSTYISATANDRGNKLVEAAEADAALWTVVVDENGYITFLCDGKYLTSGETGNSLTLADAASDYSLWTLEEAENGWFIKNVNASYNGNAQYLEYYSGFTTYGKKDTSDVNLYTFQFVIVESAVEPNPNPGTGDAIFAVLSILAVSGMGITAAASKKN